MGDCLGVVRWACRQDSIDASDFGHFVMLELIFAGVVLDNHGT